MTSVVLIEDNQQNARMAEKILKRAGYDVYLASDGETGLELLQDIVVDLILVDLGLPDMDGQTVVALLNQQPSLAGVPIIAFTAWPEATAGQMALAYGCHGVITKPINTRTFADQIADYIATATA